MDAPPPPPRKRGRPAKHAKLGNHGSALVTTQLNSRTVVAAVVGLPDTATAAISNNKKDISNSNSGRKGEGNNGMEDVEIMEQTIPPGRRPGQRGRPRKKSVLMVPKKRESGAAAAAGKAAGNSISDRELRMSELEDEELPVERPLEKPATRRSKKISQAVPVLFPTPMESPRGHAPLYDDGGVGNEDVKDAPFMDAVVKVFCVHTEPNFSLPWQRKRQFSSNSSGFIINDRRVLTNAHSVEHHTQVKVKKRGSDTKYLATVLAIGTECDIGTEILCLSFKYPSSE
jgi:hypothetical protein